MLAATLGAYFAVPQPFQKYALGLLLLIQLGLYLRLRERHVQPRERYAKDGA